MTPTDPDFADMVQLYVDEGYDRTIAYNAVLQGVEPPPLWRVRNSPWAKDVQRLMAKSPYNDRGDLVYL